MSATFTLRSGTQRETAGALVSLGGVDVGDGDGDLRAFVGVGHPAAGRPSWLTRGGCVAVPGWGVLRLLDVQLAPPGRAVLEFVAQA